MKLSLVSGLTALGVSCAVSCAAPSASTVPTKAAVEAKPTRRALVQKVLAHNVRIVIYEGTTARRTASGVVVGAEATPKGAYSYVVTNAHALDPTGLVSPRIQVFVQEGFDEVDYAAEPVAVGAVPEMDLAVLKVRGASLKPAVLAEDTELTLGDDVVVVAAPYGKSMSLSGGMISQVEWDPASRQPRMLKTDAPIGYGASGGGIYSRDSGNLLAIVEGYRTAKVGFAVAEKSFSFDVPMPGETFAAPSSKVRRFLQAHGFGRFMGSPLNGTGEDNRAALR